MDQRARERDRRLHPVFPCSAEEPPDEKGTDRERTGSSPLQTPTECAIYRGEKTPMARMGFHCIFFLMKKKINLGIFQRREENSFLVIQACQIEDSDFTHAAKML